MLCQWNLNSITAHNFLKIPLLNAYLTAHKTDIVCLFETYLDSTFPVKYEIVAIQGYNLVRYDYHANNKGGRVCIYYKTSCCLFKIFNNQSPSYLFQIVPSPNTRYFAQNSENIPQLRAKDDFFKNSFFPSTIKEWNNPGPRFRTNERMTFLKKIKSINCSILEFSDAVVTKILLLGDNTLINSSNTLI